MVVVVLAGVLGASPAHAAPPPPRLANSVDAVARAHLTIVGGQASSGPLAVAAAGDVNGDGLGDVVVGASPFSCSARTGAAYVVFGVHEPATVSLGDLGNRGFAIRGSGEDGLGASVDGAGDVNGDGLADVIVGAPTVGFERGEPPSVGGDARRDAYVVFGKRDVAAVDVENLGDGGYWVLGRRAETSCIFVAGSTVAGLGDVNGDGRADVLVGTWAPRPLSPLASSAAVVFGRTAGNVALETLGDAGYEIEASALAQFAAAGDVNGDGRGDVVVGWPDFSRTGTCGAGGATVLFGKPDSRPASVRASRDEGIVVRGSFPGRPGKDGCNGGELLGSSVAAAGDLDGDGLGEVLLGGFGTVVLHGRATGGTVDSAGPDAPVTRLSGLSSAVGAGDVTGDDRPDVVGTASALLPAAAVVSGASALANFELPPGPGGWLVRATTRVQAAGVGDVDGEGRADIAVSEEGSEASADRQRVLVVTERPALAAGRCVNATAGTAGIDTAAGSDAGDRISGFASFDILAGFGGEDCLFGGPGDDVLYGGDGDDRLEGGDDHDLVGGAAGDDALYGGRGRDRLLGGSGDDRVDAADGAVDGIDCGAGRDKVRADAFDRIRGCERKRLLPGKPRACVVPSLRVTGPVRARVGETVELRVRIVAPTTLEAAYVTVNWGRRAVNAAGGQNYETVRPGTVRRSLNPRLRFRYGRAGRFRVEADVYYQPRPGCGEEPESVSLAPRQLLIVR